MRRRVRKKKLYLPAAGDGKLYPHLEPILSKPIQWGLIQRQYDEMVNYTTAPRIGSADPESILRRFMKNNAQHPTYRALAELGKGGEVASNRLEDQELPVLSLHLLQNCMVYVNTLMIQSVLADPAWRKRLEAGDYRALTSLISTSRAVEPRRKQA